VESGSWDPRISYRRRTEKRLAIEDDLVEREVKLLVTMITIN